MKILIYSANFAPEPTGIGKYSGEMASWLAANGHEVRVVCAPPYYPAWAVDEGYQWPPYRRESWRGVDVWRAPLWVPHNPKGMSRVVHLFSFALSSFPVMLWQIFWRPAVVLTVAPAVACAPSGWLTSRLSGAKAWLHIQDFEVDVAFRMGLLKGCMAQRAVLWLESRLLRRFDVVSTISHNMLKRLDDKHVKPERQRFFPNWANVNAVKPLTAPSTYRAELGIPDAQIVALFSGTWGSKQGLMLLPQVANLLAHRADITFVIAGDGVMRPDIEAACAKLSNVILLPLQPIERLGELLGLADIHLLPQSPEAEDLVLPSKLTGMLSSGRPVIATCREGTEIARVVQTCGLVVPPDSPQAMADAVENLADHPQGRIKMGTEARRFADDNLAQDTILRQLVSDFEALHSANVDPSPSKRA